MIKQINENELLPCPFCSGPPKSAGIVVACLRCGATGPLGGGPMDIAAWNTRAAPKPADAQVQDGDLAEVQSDVLAEIMGIVPATPLAEGMQRDIVADIKRLLARRQSTAFDEKVVRKALTLARTEIEGDLAVNTDWPVEDVQNYPAIKRIDEALAELAKGTHGPETSEG